MSTARPIIPVTINDESWSSCMDCSEEFFKSLEFGRIRGIAVIASGTGRSGELTALAQELIQRDILAVIRGEAAAEIAEAEQDDPSMFEQADSGLLDLCDYIGIHPVVYMSPQADDAAMLEFFSLQAELTGKGIAALPFTAMTAGPDSSGSAPESVYGTVFRMEDDPVRNADRLEDYIHDRRLAFDWCDRFYCTEVAYS